MADTYQWQSATPMPTAKQRADPEWERKQRNREYRVAARREKRNRKADEKKQRKLNATILRRMTRNPEKYAKNAVRNKTRAIDSERRAIWLEAVRQAERLAAKHDPTGQMFNVGPVKILEDGSVVSEEVLQRREERRKEKEAKAAAEANANDREAERLQRALLNLPANMPIPKDVDPEKFKMIAAQNQPAPRAPGISKTQQKKLEKYAPKPIPPKPVLPDGIEIPEGETNWIAMWDLSDGELDRRIAREKKRKQTERKNLRKQQQAGKRERRAARDEKRKVYRDLKDTWKLIKASEKKHKTMMKSQEDREAKAIAVELNIFQRQQAMAICAELGFTLENTEGVEDIRPVVRGTKGKQIDWDNLDIGEGNDIRPKDQKESTKTNSRRVDLSKAAGENELQYIGAGGMDIDDVEFAGDDEDDDDESEDEMAANKDEIRLDVGSGDAHETVNYNHRMRRKIRRALENQAIQREILVRENAIKHLESQGLPVPEGLRTSPKPVHEKGKRLLENGTLETDKQERVRARIELTEFNNAAKVLRRQAKAIALEAGLRIYAEMTGRIPKSSEPKKEAWDGCYGEGWYVPPKPSPEDMLKPSDVGGYSHGGDDRMDVDDEEESDQGFTLHGVRF